ncbi:MAG: hypothetical protein A3G80_01080 [Betaproteobacteria bacterium RIFCSPLOWO2_12_FULL_62_13b]|nr:MAG: hypothetical protein A3G80_01080 [Betaproteobacteria bacterium RIFCSPLOWO2_12_FULL_62_13b]
METEQAISELRKDPEQERLLASVNELLRGVEDKLESVAEEPRKPTVFFVGVPRSGSTLTSQVLSSSGAFGYISNFIARFWMAPKLGIVLQQALKIIPGAVESGYHSEYGVTQGWAEPHEFGYFWNRWFDVGVEVNKLTDEELQRVDRAGLRRAVAAMEEAFGAPMLFKNETWCSFQINFLADLFPKSIFLVTEREPIFAAQSILMLRKKHLDSREQWLSMKPREYFELRHLPWWEQIGGQLYYTNREIERALEQVPPERIVRSNYLGFCQAPQRSVAKVLDAVEKLSGERPAVRGRIPSAFESADFQRVSDEEFRLLREGRKKYSG